MFRAELKLRCGSFVDFIICKSWCFKVNVVTLQTQGNFNVMPLQLKYNFSYRILINSSTSYSLNTFKVIENLRNAFF